MVQILSVIPDSITISIALPCPIRRMASEREAGPHRKERFSDASGLAQEGGAAATVEDFEGLLAARDAGNPRLHPRPLHNGTQDTIDPGRVTFAVLHKPVVNFLVDASGHQHLRSATKLRQLLVAQGRDARVINAGIISPSLPLRDPGQDGLLLFIRRLAEYRFGAHAY